MKRYFVIVLWLICAAAFAAELPLSEGIPRFKANEDRVDRFVNTFAPYTTNTGTPASVESLPAFMVRKETELDAYATAANGDTLVEDEAALIAADASGSVTSIVLLQSFAMTQNIPLTKALKIKPGVLITTTGYTLTVNGPFSAKGQCFGGTGAVVFGPGSISVLESEWFGLDTANTATANATALQAAFAASIADADARHPVHASAGTYSLGLVYAPEGIIFYGDGAVIVTGSSGTLFVQETGSDTDTLRVTPHGGPYPTRLYWYGTIRDMSFLGDATGSAGSAISFTDSNGDPVTPMDTTIIKNISVRRYPGDGVSFPDGAQPLTVSNINLLWNGGYGISFYALSEFSHQAITMSNISGDGNIGGALLYFDGLSKYGSVVINNLKSEKRINTDRGSVTAQENAIIFNDCIDTPVTINGITHISSVPDGGNFEKPGDAIVIAEDSTGRPLINFNSVAVRVRGTDTGTDPATIMDSMADPDVNIPYTTKNGLFGTSPFATGVFSSASSATYFTFGLNKSYQAASSEAPGFQISGALPGLSLYETDAAADSKMWLHAVSGGTYSLRAIADDGLTSSVVLQLTRTGIASGKIILDLDWLPTYADNAAATAGGEVAGTLYRTATGSLLVVY